MNRKILEILLFAICTIFATNAFAQRTFQQSDIIGKKWKLDNFTDYPFYTFVEYTDTGKIVFYRQGKPLLETTYYLSDTIESTFYKSKVYDNTEGKFFIYREKDCGNRPMEIYKILSLTDDKLILKDNDFGNIFIYTTNEDSLLYIEFYGGPALDCKPVLDYEKFTQQTFKKSDITNKKWFEVCSNWKFEYDYYLSDAIETTFNESKVGKSTSGRYIIERDDKGQVYASKILKLTGNKLKLKLISWSGILDINTKTKTVCQAVEK